MIEWVYPPTQLMCYRMKVFIVGSVFEVVNGKRKKKCSSVAIYKTIFSCCLAHREKLVMPLQLADLPLSEAVEMIGHRSDTCLNHQTENKMF